MSRLIPFALLLLWPAVAVGQTKDVQKEVRILLNQNRSQQDAERTEDIEVLRRILNRAVGVGEPARTSIGYSASMYGQHVAGPGAIGPFDGVYLTGHGVVFTLKIPAASGVVLDPTTASAGLIETCLRCHTAVPANLGGPSLAKPITEWDRTRDELHGSKPSPDAKSTPASPICEPGRMTELLIAKLAENARHIRHLSNKEQLTIVVTFDGYSGSAKDRRVITRDVMLSRPQGIPTRAGFTPEEAQFLTLGDLHLKQNKPKEAAEAYAKALAKFRDPNYRLTVPPTLTSEQKQDLAAQLQKNVRDLFLTLAKAYLQIGDDEQAQAALVIAARFRVDLSEKEAAPPAPVKADGIAVPAKLLIAVTRAAVEQATDDGTIRKAVKVETVGFPPADRRP